MVIKSKKSHASMGAKEIITHWSGGHRIEKVGNHGYEAFQLPLKTCHLNLLIVMLSASVHFITNYIKI